jgi:hypothetical protein
MSKTEDYNSINRRDFLKFGVVGVAAVAGLDGLGRIAEAASKSGVTPVYRTLGRTGLKVSIISFGAMLTPDYETMETAFNLGINYVDTARIYMNGRNEEIVGKALKGRRDKVYVATKTLPASQTKKDIFSDVERSLSKLKTDYIDIIQLHNLINGDRAFMPEAREALTELRKQGKVRFFGVTTHTNQAGVLKAITDDPTKFFDVALVGYNFKSEPSIKEAVTLAAKAGVGIVAMKTQAGGYKTDALGPISPHQAALKWVLQDTNVACAIPGMKDMSMLQEASAVMGMKLTRRDERILHQYAEAINPYYCHMCAQCEPTCPQNISISIINRSIMYAEGYGNYELARSTYDELQGNESALACSNCDECVAHCVNGLNIEQKMRKARVLFA